MVTLATSESRAIHRKDLMAQNTQVCGACKTVNDSTAQFCSNCGRLLAVGLFDPITRISTPRGIVRLRLIKGFARKVLDIAWSPDGKILAAPSDNKTVVLWDVQTWEKLHDLHMGHHVSTCVAISSNSQVVSVDDSSNIHFWNGNSGDKLYEFKAPFAANSVAWSPDGYLLAFGSRDKKAIHLYSWDGRKATSLPSLLKAHTHVINSVAWSPDGRVLASGSSDKTVRFWHWNGQRVKLLPIPPQGHTESISSLAWSPNGRILASGSSDKTIYLWYWNGQKAKPLPNPLKGHTHTIRRICFSGDGRLLVSKSDGIRIFLWATGIWEELGQLSGLGGNREDAAMAFHPSLPLLATHGEQDDEICIWEIDIDALLRVAPVVVCPQCKFAYHHYSFVQDLLDRNVQTFLCAVCRTEIILLDQTEIPDQTEILPPNEMDDAK